MVVLHAKVSRKGKLSSGERFQNAFVNAGQNVYFFLFYHFLFFILFDVYLNVVFKSTR